jgi:hypothetical protein
MLMVFSPLRDGSKKKRLEADYVGSGTAWIATNGETIKGTWRKSAIDKPTLFFDAAGKPVTFTVGQTFVQVLPRGSKVSIEDGRCRRCPGPSRRRSPADPTRPVAVGDAFEALTQRPARDRQERRGATSPMTGTSPELDHWPASPAIEWKTTCPGSDRPRRRRVSRRPRRPAGDIEVDDGRGRTGPGPRTSA